MYKCETANTLTCYYYVLLLLLLLLSLLACSLIPSIALHSFVCSFARLIEERMKRKENVTRCKAKEEENEEKNSNQHFEPSINMAAMVFAYELLAVCFSLSRPLALSATMCFHFFLSLSSACIYFRMQTNTRFFSSSSLPYSTLSSSLSTPLPPSSPYTLFRSRRRVFESQ